MSPGNNATLFLSGDVMTGRGIDQVLPRSVGPRLHEQYVESAKRYVEIAERTSGSIPPEVSHEYVWGDGLAELTRKNPDASVINLETAVTTSDHPAPGKGIHYRMHPANAGIFGVPDIDCCVLANNHTLDWGEEGLEETLNTLRNRDISVAGAGGNAEAASQPAVLQSQSGERLLVFACAHKSSGVPPSWRAESGRPGINLLPSLGSSGAELLLRQVREHREPGDRVITSIHWGGNWGYGVPDAQRNFARALLESGAVDIVHGHSSHHPKGIEVYRGRLILYGCGDLINDYEGISGHEEYRGDLSLMYFPELEGSGRLASLEMAPMKIRRFRLNRPGKEERRWLAKRLNRECRKFGTSVEETGDGRLNLQW